MSYVSQFLSGTSGSSSSGGKPIGAMELFPPNMGNSFTLPDGTQYLLGGVIAKSTDYPSVPNVFLKQLSPVTKLSDIGSGGVWRAMCIDSLGFPVVLQSAIFNQTGHAYRISGTSSTVSTDVSLISNTGTNYPGSYGISIAMNNTTLIIGRDFTQSMYGQGPVHAYSVTPGSNNAPGGPSYLSSSGNWQAMASSGSHMIAIPRGGSSSVYLNSTSFSPGASNSVSMTAAIAWTAAACNNLRFVAVATGSNTMNYSDGLTVTSWTASTMPSSAQWISVASNGTGFLAVAANGSAAATSANGITWAASTLPLSQNWSSVCWSSTLGQYVAVAKGSNTGAVSANGTSWSTITLPKTANWESVIFSPTLNRLFISGTDGTGVWMSADGGVTWAEKLMPRAIQFERLEYSNGGFHAYTFGNAIAAGGQYPYNPITARSTDGVNWVYNNAIPTSLTHADSAIRTIGAYIGFTNYSSNNITLYYSSNNGITYSSVAVLSDFTFSIKSSDLAFNGAKYIAPIMEYFDSANSVWRESPWVMSSSNITSWTLINTGVSAHWRCIVAKGSTFIMAGYNDAGFLVIARSPDGTSWAYSSLPTVATNNQDVNIQYDANRGIWVLSLGYSSFPGVLVSSDDGLTWLSQLKTYGALVQNGARYTAVVGITNNTYVDAQSTNLYAEYTHGVSIKSNTIIPISGYCAPLLQAGTNYYLSSSSMYTLDSGMYIDNRGSPSESSGQAYYMRVK